MPKATTACRAPCFLTVASEAATYGRVGRELSKHLLIGLDKFKPGESIKALSHLQRGSADF